MLHSLRILQDLIDAFGQIFQVFAAASPGVALHLETQIDLSIAEPLAQSYRPLAHEALAFFSYRHHVEEWTVAVCLHQIAELPVFLPYENHRIAHEDSEKTPPFQNDPFCSILCQPAEKVTEVKILVLSDSHRTMRYMERAVEIEKPDQIIHLGDHVSDAESLSERYSHLPVLMVSGNCDFVSNHREQIVTDFRGVRFLISHGHRYGVKSSLLRYLMAARENQVLVALFGHTHLALCEKHGDIWLLNPGSCGYGSRPSYGIVEIDRGSLSCRVVYFDE